MEDKSAIIISLTDAFKLKSDLIDIGYSTSIVSSYSKLPYCGKNEKQPDLIIAEVEFCSDIDFIQRKGELLSHFSSSPIIFLLDKVFANDLTQKGLLKKTGYITPDYSLRELELCIDTLPSHSKELKTPNIWVDQANLTTIFNILPNGILICDKDGNIQSVNDAFTEILGYSREELCSMNIRGFTLTETHVLIEQNIRKILNGETIHTEVINICKDGSFKNLELVEKRITLSNGETGVLSIATDVTYWKEINNSLKESEEKYRILVEKSNDGIIFSQGEILVYANPKINEMIGYSHDEIIGQPFHFFLHPDERERIIEKYQRRKLGDNAPEIYETLLQKKNGESLSVEFNVNMATYKGKPATMVFIRDITQRKVSEKFLKESEESYRSVFDNASEAIYIQDANGVFLDVNKAASNLYGYPKSEIIGYTPEKLSAPGRNDMTDAVRRLKEAFEGKSQIFEFWGLTKAGREFPKEVVLNKGKYFGKDVVFAMARDISERKNAEAILMESEEKYRTLAEQIPVGIYRTSESGTFYYANPALAQILGFEKVDDLLTHNVNEFFANSQERLEVLKLYKKSNDYVQSEFAMIRIDGKQIWIRDNGKANYDSKGNITFFDGVVENITLQREANEALKKSEANLRATLNAIPDLMFRFNREGVYLDLHSYNKNDLVIDSSRILGNSIKDFFTEEFSNTIIVNINKCIDTGSLQTFEYEVPLKGEVNHFEARMIPVGANEVLVFSRNITDKKRAEEKINMLAQTIINIVESVSITDIGNRIIYVNPAFLEMYGYTEEEIIWLFVEDFIDIQNIDEFIDKTFQELWNKTEYNLENIRNKFNIDFRDKYIGLLDNLQCEIISFIDRQSVTELLNNIMTCRTEIQTKLSNISKWFRRSESSNEGEYELQILAETSIQITKNLNPSYQFDIEKRICPNLNINGEYHQHFIDLMNNCMFNIIKHAHLPSETLNAKLTIEEIDTNLILNFENCVLNPNEHLEKLKAIKQNWENPDTNISQEGGTGFPKIKKIIHSDLNRRSSNFDFHFDSNKLNIILSFETNGLKV